MRTLDFSLNNILQSKILLISIYIIALKMYKFNNYIVLTVIPLIIACVPMTICTTQVVSSTPVHGEVYSIQHYVIKICQWLATGPWFSPGTPVSSTNITDRHDIAEIMLKVALNTITKSKPITIIVSISSSTTCRHFSCRSCVVDLIIAISYKV